MSSESELLGLIQLGQDLNSFKFYAVSVTALLIYDYLLTLKDEIRYAWKTESILILVLFLFIPSTGVPVVVTYRVNVSGIYNTGMCNKSAFIQVLYFTFISAFAQIFLAQRTYAITRKNKWVAGTLYTVSAAQFGVGVFMIVWAITKPSVELPNILLDAYHLCLADIEKTFTIVQMSLSLTFDITVFALVVMQTQIFKSAYRGMNRPMILDTVSRDAEIYFAVIATSHFLAVIMYIATRPGIRSLPVVGNAVFIPMMVSRMIMSLKKAATEQRPYTSMELPIGQLTDTHDVFPPRAADNIQLSVLK